MLSPHDAWHATLGQLELQLNRATFETWLKGSELVACNEGEMTIRVRHAYAKDWLEQHLYHLIVPTVSSLVGEPMRVTFVISGPTPPTVEPQPGTLFADLPDDEGDHPDRPQVKAAANGAATAASDSAASIAEEEATVAPRDPIPAPVRAESVADAARTATPGESHAPERIAPHLAGAQPFMPEGSFNRRYTLESFIPGPSNLFAHAAAKAVAASPGAAYNPFLIYGGSGLGKTHLLHAIGAACDAAGKSTLYVTAETFTNELVAAIRAHTTAEFRERYRHVDVLLVDDVQFIAGKSSTEEEFYHVFNALLGQNSQVVMASSAHPRALNTLDERLRCRFEGALLADIQPPDEPTRLAILKARSEAAGLTLPEDVAGILAAHEVSNVRELEGLLIQVEARVKLTHEALDAALAYRVLGKADGAQPATNRAGQRKGADLKDILKATATYHQLSMDDLLSKSRTKSVVRARQIAMYLAREETEASLPQIGEALGRNHSTILHGYKKIAGEVPLDDELRRELSAIRRQLYTLPN